MSSNFHAKLVKGWEAGRFVSVGLDPRMDQIPAIPGLVGVTPGVAHEMEGAPTDTKSVLTLGRYCARIVSGVAEQVLAFKPNIAFYERFGSEGLRILQQLTGSIRQDHPDVVLILDYKRGDIGDTNIPYVELAAKVLKADAVTINPYMGMEANKPFLDSGLGVIPIVKTSNPGSGEFQDQLVLLQGAELDHMMSTHTREVVQEIGGMHFLPLYQLVAHRVRHFWNTNQNCAVVVGATYPQELAAVRQIVNGMPILIPGIGKQGGDLEASVKAGLTNIDNGIIVNSSRGVIHRTMGADAVEQAQAEVARLNAGITRFRAEAMAERRSVS